MWVRTLPPRSIISGSVKLTAARILKTGRCAQRSLPIHSCRPLGSRPRAADWSAVTSCLGHFASLPSRRLSDQRRTRVESRSVSHDPEQRVPRRICRTAKVTPEGPAPLVRRAKH
jgi:hypothetical protein